MRQTPVPYTEVLVRFTKSTTRALAASVAFVAAGATVAGAAAFQLPSLGFGRANVASAAATPGHAKPAVASVRRKVEPKVIVKTRYVTDIVHRRAPARAYTTSAAPAPAAPVAPVAVAPASRTFVPAPAIAPSTTIAPSSSTTTSPTTAWTEDGPDSHDHGTAPATGHSTDTAPVQAPVVDQ
jgi:hypothetical protein